jgi:hypothetical protein
MNHTTKIQGETVKTTKLLFALTCVLGIAANCFGQDAAVETKKTPGILGYLDPKTGSFRPVQTQDKAPSAPGSGTQVTGTVVFTVTATLNPAIPAGAKIECSAKASVGSEPSLSSNSHQAQVMARRSGKTATCTVNIPYTWTLTSPSGDTLQMDVDMTALIGTSGTLPNSDAVWSDSLWIPLPPSGSTTTEAFITSM